MNHNASGFVGQYAHGNEPSHHVAYLYNFAGQPWKTQKYVSHILNTLYNNTSSGYAGMMTAVRCLPGMYSVRWDSIRSILPTAGISSVPRFWMSVL